MNLHLEIMPLTEMSLDCSEIRSVAVTGRLTVSDDRHCRAVSPPTNAENHWTLSRPTQPGLYWIGQRNTTLVRMMRVFWRGTSLVTKEETGVSVSVLDSLYRDTWWMGPVVPPPPPGYRGQRR